jgi:hypothetical protein
MQHCVTLAVLCLVAACHRTADGPRVVLQPAAGGAPAAVAVEVVDEPDELERGLMWRSELPDGRGMLFVFPADEDHVFWMKNTLIPLDMIFIARDGPDRGRVVGVRANTTPLSLKPEGVGAPSRWVLEVPGGWSARHGIDAGAAVTFEAIPAG